MAFHDIIVLLVIVAGIVQSIASNIKAAKKQQAAAVRPPVRPPAAPTGPSPTLSTVSGQPFASRPVRPMREQIDTVPNPVTPMRERLDTLPNVASGARQAIAKPLAGPKSATDRASAAPSLQLMSTPTAVPAELMSPTALAFSRAREQSAMEDEAAAASAVVEQRKVEARDREAALLDPSRLLSPKSIVNAFILTEAITLPRSRRGSRKIR